MYAASDQSGIAHRKRRDVYPTPCMRRVEDGATVVALGVYTGARHPLWELGIQDLAA